MDKVIRQVGQHIEFDPEWETAFNLVIKIQSVLSSILEWCSLDVRKIYVWKKKIFFISFYRKNYC